MTAGSAFWKCVRITRYHDALSYSTDHERRPTTDSIDTSWVMKELLLRGHRFLSLERELGELLFYISHTVETVFYEICEDFAICLSVESYIQLFASFSERIL
jgi:hypothetical protein